LELKHEANLNEDKENVSITILKTQNQFKLSGVECITSVVFNLGLKESFMK